MGRRTSTQHSISAIAADEHVFNNSNSNQLYQ